MKCKKMTVEEILAQLKEGTSEENKAQLKSLYTPIVNAMNGILDEIVKGAADKEDLAKIDELKEAVSEINGEKGLKNDITQLFEQVKNVNAVIAELKKQGMKQETISKFDEQLNAMFDSERFADFVAGRKTKSGEFDISALKSAEYPVNLTSNYTGSVLISQQQKRVIDPYAGGKTHLREVLATEQGDPQFPNLTYNQISALNRNARFVTENGLLPESAFSVKEVTTGTKRLGTTIFVSKRMLKSRVWVRSYLLNKIPVCIAMAEDWNILFGDGQGENLEGIVNNENVKSVEIIISNAVVTGTAGSVASVATYNSGADTIITFAAAQPDIRSGQSIVFTGAAEHSPLLSAKTLIKMNDTQILLPGVAYQSETAANLAFTVNNQFYQNIEDPNSEDVIRTAFAVMNYGEYNPTVIVLNPSDVNTIQGEKDTTGRSLNLVTVVNGRKYIAGYLIIESTQIPVGKYFLGDTINGASLVDYTNLTLEWAEDVETKRRNVVALIAQEEVILAIYNPFAFAYGDLASLKTAITKPAEQSTPETHTTTTVVYEQVDATGQNPASKGYYKKVNGEFVAASETSPADNTTYYTRTETVTEVTTE